MPTPDKKAALGTHASEAAKRELHMDNIDMVAKIARQLETRLVIGKRKRKLQM
jgi:hypothetical protein